MRRTAFDLDALISHQPRHQAAAAAAAVGQQQAAGNSGAAGGAGGSGRDGDSARAVTPARMPAPAHLEYLDVFDFFNYPRLPVSFEGGMGAAAAEGGARAAAAAENGLNGFSIGSFSIDASSDWLSQQLDTF